MGRIYRSLLAFSIVHVRDDEALRERYKVIILHITITPA
jgi:hypothetical protein